jgi:MoxR-like ATPase
MPSPANETTPIASTANDLADLAATAALRERFHSAIAPVVIGQRELLDDLLAAILCGGHCLIEGVPGLAKTLVVKSLAQALALDFGRIQFTPDLMPADITGTEVLEEDRGSGGRRLRFLTGPIFANVLLADEINRAPPKTQAAVLEAMQERQVTVGGRSHPLPDPFFLLATRNPLDQEGTYPLPEGQLDRFMFLLQVEYPNRTDEIEIVRRTTGSANASLAPVIDRSAIAAAARIVHALPVADHVLAHAVDLVRSTRPGSAGEPEWLPRLLRHGAGPRASRFLLLAAKAHAALDGRPCVEIRDLNRAAPAVLRHRLITTFEADSEGISPDEIIARLITLRARSG